MNSNDVTVGAELEAEWPDGRWRPAKILRRCGQEGDPGPADCLFDVLTGGGRGLRHASQLRRRRSWSALAGERLRLWCANQLRPRRHWLLRLLRPRG